MSRLYPPSLATSDFTSFQQQEEYETNPTDLFKTKLEPIPEETVKWWDRIKQWFLCSSSTTIITHPNIV